MVNTTDRSTILLLCLGLDTDKKEVKSLRAMDLLKMFSSTGKLKRILVFSKQLLLKAFLEYSSYEEAAVTISKFHEKFIGKYGKARLHFSARQQIVFSNKYLDFWDEKTAKNGNHQFENESTDFSLLHENQTFSNDKENLIPLLEGSFISNSFSWLDRRKSTETAFNLNFNKESSRISYQESQLTKTQQNLRIFNEKKEFQSQKENSRNYVGKSSHFRKKQQIKPNQYVTYNNLSKLNGQEKQRQNLISKSKVVIVSNLSYVFNGPEELFNLLSCFGIIKGIIYMKNLQKALVEFSTEESAKECIININNLFLGPTKLKINYSHHREINFDKSQMNQTSLQFNEIVKMPDHKQRYKNNAKISPNPISPSVIVEADWTYQVIPKDIYHFIEKHCKPKVVKMADRTEGDKDETKQIRLHLVFEDVNSAIYVIYKCHNKKLRDSLIRISFY